MTNNLLLFTIGPVQSFIAQARKTQDLFAGSKLLSKLIDFAIGKVKVETTNENGEKLSNIIFPADNIDSKPNRFLAIIDDSQIETARKLADDVKEEFKRIATESFKDKPQNFDDQITNFLDINWVILPYEEEKYKETYKEIERTMGAVKNVRAFEQFEELGRKCSLCGERNVLFYKRTSNNKVPQYVLSESQTGVDVPGWYKKCSTTGAIEINRTALAPGEGLCAVCFTKRFYQPEHLSCHPEPPPCHPEPPPCHPEQSEGSKDSSASPQNDKSFLSTAGIALLDKITTDEYKQAFENNWPNGKYFDEQLLFEENLRAEYLKKYYDVKTDQEAETLIDTVKKIKQESGLEFKTKYYAIIALDGDNMGKWLSGSEEFLKPGTNLLKFQKDLSTKLGEYAKKVKNKIITEPKGSLVYAGGDDVLAFVNLNHLTDVLKTLRTSFPDFDGTGKSSASCGVAIAHYKIPLGEVLKRARKMEKAAKDKGDRNAFGIAVLKHSGEIEETVFKWNFELPDKCKLYPDCNGVNSICLLAELIDYLKKEEFSNTFIKCLNTELYKLMNNEGKIDNKLNNQIDNIVKTELDRLVERSRNKNKDVKKETAIDLSNKLNQIYNMPGSSVQNFLSFLNIADFLHREVNK